MNEFIRIKAEELPDFRQELVADCISLRDPSSLIVNNFVESEIKTFLGKLVKKYPEMNTKQIPEYQALVGGGETDEDTHDPETLRCILDEIAEFVEQTKKKKEKLQKL